jgi:hypothetical protein
VARIFKHGMSDSRLESIRETMMERCHNPDAENYARYGGKGIFVCKEWREIPASFYGWALKNGYEDGLTIDRKENHLGYTPENSRWRTFGEQQISARTTPGLNITVKISRSQNGPDVQE